MGADSIVNAECRIMHAPDEPYPAFFMFQNAKALQAPALSNCILPVLYRGLLPLEESRLRRKRSRSYDWKLLLQALPWENASRAL